MMRQGKINLLQKDLIVASRYRNLSKVSLMVLGVYMVIALGVFAFFIFLTTRKSSLESKKSALTSDIEQQRETEGLLITLKDRVNLAKSLFSTSAPTPSELISDQLDLIPPGSEVITVNAKDDGSVSLTVEAANSSEVKAFISTLKEKKPTSVILTSLITGDNGGYLYSVLVR